MAGEDLLDLKFRLYDGTDIGPDKYGPGTTIGTLKEIIVAQWPQDKENAPKTINDVKLINGGKILENSRTLAESGVPIGELPSGIITMHVVVRPPLFNKDDEIKKKRFPIKVVRGCEFLQHLLYATSFYSINKTVGDLLLIHHHITTWYDFRFWLFLDLSLWIFKAASLEKLHSDSPKKNQCLCTIL